MLDGGGGLGLFPAGGGFGLELAGGGAGLFSVNGLRGASEIGIESKDCSAEWSAGGDGGGFRPNCDFLISCALMANSLNTLLAGEL